MTNTNGNENSGSVDLSRFLLKSSADAKVETPDGKKAWQAMSRMKMDQNAAEKKLTITVHFAGYDLLERVDRLAGLHKDEGWSTCVVFCEDGERTEEMASTLREKGYAVEIDNGTK